MAPTTLITFMVRTPPTTRSVNLLGSWDNFSKPYGMQRDSRVGPEHWSGCHKFSNIIFDGDGQGERQPREGGLKMGGTYWYFYKLDDDLEFYNSAEACTTKCPLMPGQIVNVLQVPYALSGHRSRNPSVSSTGSEKHTMNPADKYINPRPVPKPRLHRLQTSPNFMSESWSSSAPTSSRSGRSATSGKGSAPNSAATVKMPLLPRKKSVDSHSHNPSPSHAVAGGIRSAFRSFRSPRSASPDDVNGDRARTIERALQSADTTPVARKGSFSQSRSLTSSREASPSTSRGRPNQLEHDLAFRRCPATGPDGSVEVVNPSSFQEHRRQRSRSREPSSLRNSLVLDESTVAPLNEVADRRKLPLSTVKEVASAQNTPGVALGGPKTADLDKRLPTLPNTPSSAYPVSATEIDPSTPFDMEQLNSHFSATTIDTCSSEPSSASADSARFSNFSSQYASTTRSSMYTESVIDDEPMSAALDGGLRTPKYQRTGDLGLASPNETEIEDTPQPTSTFPPRDLNSILATALTSSTLSSTAASSRSTSPSDYGTDGAWPRRTTSRERLHHQHYRLPTDDLGSALTIKQQTPLTSTDGGGGGSSSSSSSTSSSNNNSPPALPYRSHAGREQQPARPPAHHHNYQHHHQLPPSGPSFPPQSDGMQQLLDELSYMRDMIHHR